MSKLSETINLDEIAVDLPSRIHEVTARQVAKAPDWIALVEDGASWSYRDLERRVSEIATVLSSLGIRAGDRMIIVSENCIALAALLLATSRLDAWAIVANPRLSARELDQIATIAAPAGSSMSPTSASRRPSTPAATRRSSRCCPASAGWRSGPSMPTRCPRAREGQPPKQVAVLIYTSRTTGTPKGVMLTHHDLLVSAYTSGSMRRMTEADYIYLVLPISHIVGTRSFSRR